MARAARIALLSMAIVLVCPVYEASAEPTQQFTLAGRFVPPAAPAADETPFTDAIIWTLPLADVAALFGLTPGGYDWSYPGLMVDVWVSPGERAHVEAFALAWMYVYRQPAVPYFRTPESGSATMRLRYEANLLPLRDSSGDAVLHAIGRLHPSPGIEAKLRTLRARYDESVSRWLRARTQRLRPCCFAS